MKYENMLRYILIKDLWLIQAEASTLESRFISMANTKEQQQLLENGWIGTSIVKRNDDWFVRYEKEEN